jgi:hypothetical protein
MSLHSVLVHQYEIHGRTFAGLGVGPYPFSIQERYLNSCSCLPAPLQSALKQSDCRIDKLIYLATSELSRVKQGEQTHVCTLSETNACDDLVMKELRYVGQPTSSLQRVPP